MDTSSDGSGRTARPFPDNPAHPEGDGVPNLRASIRRALDTGKPDGMWVRRYDIPSAARPGAFEERCWSPVNTPILDADGRRLGVLHTVEDVAAELVAIATKVGASNEHPAARR